MKNIIITVVFIFGILSFKPITSQTQNCTWTIPEKISLKVNPIGKVSDSQFFVKCSCNLKKYQIEIYNKFGETVFESTSIESKWTVNKSLKGSYFWAIEATYEDDSEYSKKGKIKIQ